MPTCINHPGASCYPNGTLPQHRARHSARLARHGPNRLITSDSSRGTPKRPVLNRRSHIRRKQLHQPYSATLPLCHLQLNRVTHRPDDLLPLHTATINKLPHEQPLYSNSLHTQTNRTNDDNNHVRKPTEQSPCRFNPNYRCRQDYLQCYESNGCAARRH